MNWESFKDQFHESWHEKMQPFIESKECDEIYAFLKKESKRGKKIAPLSFNTFRAFKETPLTELKVVLMGMCPYHTFKDGLPVADGLLMGCSDSKTLQPSLQQFYDALEVEFYNGLQLNAPKSPDVSYLSRQGVLMFNAGLTVEANKAGSHNELWAPFTKYVFENIFSYTGAPIIYLGKEASKFERYMGPMSWNFTLNHPAYASYKNISWDSEGVFKKVSKIVKDNNNFEIDWLDVFPPF